MNHGLVECNRQTNQNKYAFFDQSEAKTKPITCYVLHAFALKKHYLNNRLLNLKTVYHGFFCLIDSHMKITLLLNISVMKAFFSFFFFAERKT